MRERSGSQTITVVEERLEGEQSAPEPVASLTLKKKSVAERRREVKAVIRWRRENGEHRKSPNAASLLLAALRESLLARVEAETAVVLRFQRYFAFNYYTRLYFVIYTTLFDEVCYTALFPCVAWTMSPIAGVHLGFFVALSFYAGSSLKDLLHLPRPPVPPVFRPATHLDLEFGCPSTHAMNAVLIPAALTLFYVRPHSLAELFTVSPLSSLLVVLALVWLAANVSLSRVVLGFHTPTDIWAGLALALVLLGVSVYFDLAAQLAHCLVHVRSLLVPAGVILAGVLMLVVYPLRGMNNPAFVDLIGVVCASAGYFLLLWALGVRDEHVPFADAFTSSSLSALSLWQRAQLGAARTVVGVVVLLLGKSLSRYLSTRALTLLLWLVIPAQRLSVAQRESVALFGSKCVAYLTLGLLTHLCNHSLFEMIHL
mmetsp:Transcript_36217/g.90879  ORF Transcript_36217/g.90879 Transcript_36217/m.90879 type:complete len:428 (+) Transcript_36217:31-1314(+)|eukprot:CAMPEP_0174241052 /NCGR_PEP_ID=MMETSP0417-20130205/21578_1 /TAXON_ID=242541 /ORGANISM="Mayorella sp, Strain BSH-02190019" /LENGTH=427 /DNA_ID=CAMNT_0015320241 /DNA_START=54 /DNA_END=1340 /DNA_ORIENTATION=+